MSPSTQTERATRIRRIRSLRDSLSCDSRILQDVSRSVSLKIRIRKCSKIVQDKVQKYAIFVQRDSRYGNDQGECLSDAMTSGQNAKWQGTC